jgi:hypothetical protein
MELTGVIRQDGKIEISIEVDIKRLESFAKIQGLPGHERYGLQPLPVLAAGHLDIPCVNQCIASLERKRTNRDAKGWSAFLYRQPVRARGWNLSLQGAKWKWVHMAGSGTSWQSVTQIRQERRRAPQCQCLQPQPHQLTDYQNVSAHDRTRRDAIVQKLVPEPSRRCASCAGFLRFYRSHLDGLSLCCDRPTNLLSMEATRSAMFRAARALTSMIGNYSGAPRANPGKQLVFEPAGCHGNRGIASLQPEDIQRIPHRYSDELLAVH